jgi:hypothetical protein
LFQVPLDPAKTGADFFSSSQEGPYVSANKKLLLPPLAIQVVLLLVLVARVTRFFRIFAHSVIFHFRQLFEKYRSSPNLGGNFKPR